MAEAEEFRCFVGGLSWNTTDKGLEDEFRHFGSVLEAKVIVDKETGHSRGFGFVNFGDERSMDEAIERLHGKELDGRPITVNRAKPKGRDGGGGGDRGYGGGGGGRGGGGGGGDCFKCGQPGHWARECPTGGGDRGGGGRYSGRDRYDSGRLVSSRPLRIPRSSAVLTITACALDDFSRVHPSCCSHREGVQ